MSAQESTGGLQEIILALARIDEAQRKRDLRLASENRRVIERRGTGRMLLAQPQIQSRNFVSDYRHDGGLHLDVYGQFDGSGDFRIEAIGLSGTSVDVSNLVGDSLHDTITGWCEFMRTSWGM
jgi:hypothetical protein